MFLTRSLIAGQHSLSSENTEKLKYKHEKQLPITHQAAVRSRKTSNPPKPSTKKAEILQLITQTVKFNKLGPKILLDRWDISAP